jgi:hypothetical protein
VDVGVQAQAILVSVVFCISFFLAHDSIIYNKINKIYMCLMTCDKFNMQVAAGVQTEEVGRGPEVLMDFTLHSDVNIMWLLKIVIPKGQ